MRAVQVFQDSDTERLRKIINEWLSLHPEYSVTDYLQSQSYSEMSGHVLTITIFYIDMER